jgi:hypothetical protein
MLLWPVDVRAQHAVVFGAYYAPFYYPYFYGSWFYGYGWYPPYGYQFGYADTSVRVQVTPRETEVFVDGYYAGRVDDFDGVFQRLHVEPGEHEIQLYLPGHRIATQRVYLQPGGSFNIRRAMEPLAAGEREPLRPEPAQPSGPSPRTATPGGGARRDPRVPPDREPPAPRDGPRTSARSEFGVVTFRVQPGDAEILIDGERWRGPNDDETLVVQLAPGRHLIEVRKDGYRTFTSEIDVPAAETVPVNVSLLRQ